MKYLIIDKRQRVSVDSMGEYPTADVRIMEELDKRGIPYHFAYNDELEFVFTNGETKILANSKDITEFTRIIFRGHSLSNGREYQYKRFIIDHIEQYNVNNTGKKILIQNSGAIKNMPYYNKISMAMICSQYEIPFFETYFRTDGDYSKPRDILNDYPLIIKEYAGVNRLQLIDGKKKVKKNVYKLEKAEDYKQEFLRDKKLNHFFIQEFSPAGKDMRIFVSLGKVVGGWVREAKDGFMTVSDGIYSMYNNPDKEIRDIAEKFANVLDADFMAVDFMFIKDKPYIQEISLHPGFKAYETKIEGDPINIAEVIIDSFKDR
jgi:glutathione synthase/RimK-type ligase-like ATP-grasp enzyme